MQTLLEKVTSIEAEAQDKIRRAEESGNKELNDLLAGEEHALTGVKADAEKRAARIVQENIDKMDNEINALRQQGETAIASIHTTAKQRRAEAIKQAWNLLEQADQT